MTKAIAGFVLFVSLGLVLAATLILLACRSGAALLPFR